MTPKLKSIFELDLVEIKTRMINHLRTKNIDGYKVFVAGIHTHAVTSTEFYARIELELEQPDEHGMRLMFVDIPINDLC